MRLRPRARWAPPISRREQMLRAALEVIAERGYADTRIADVAERTGISPALVIYYFKTKDQLLTEAIRYLENIWYADGQRRMAELPTAAARIEEIVAMSCLPEADAEPRSSWTLWLDFWALAARNPEVAGAAAAGRRALAGHDQLAGARRPAGRRVPGGGPGQLRDPAVLAARRAGRSRSRWTIPWSAPSGPSSSACSSSLISWGLSGRTASAGVTGDTRLASRMELVRRAGSRDGRRPD